MKQPTSPLSSIGPGLPSVPWKLVNGIQAKEFVDTAEFLPNRMGVITAPLFADEKDEKQPMKTKILVWVYCYISTRYVCSSTDYQPSTEIPDLIAYQVLTVEAYLE